MTVAALSTFRQALSGCEIAVLADISAGSVLAWDSALKWPQEQLDALCDLASRALSIGAPLPTTAVVADALGCQVFIRIAANSDEVLCGVFAPDQDLDDVLMEGRRFCTVLDAQDTSEGPT
ncbi:hypothetical protein [Tropicibacter sp. S64]|uniref:hypothetical protein n=1 Tax=Tropicibacter sp. S64 TaxID=3415122 RepID=UPI003C7C3C3F